MYFALDQGPPTRPTGLICDLNKFSITDWFDQIVISVISKLGAMNDLNNMWNTVRTNSTQSNSQSAQTSGESGSKPAPGPNPFTSSSIYGSSPHHGNSSFTANEQKSPTASRGAFNSKKYSSEKFLSPKASFGDTNVDPFESLVDLGLHRKSSKTNLTLEERRRIDLEKKLNSTLPGSVLSSSPAEKHFWEKLDSNSDSTVKSVPLTPTRSFSPLASSISSSPSGSQKPSVTEPFEALLGPAISVNDNQSLRPDDDPFGLSAFSGPSQSSHSPTTDRPALPKRYSNPLGVLASPVVPKVKLEENSSDEEEFDGERQSSNGNRYTPTVDLDVDHLITKVMDMGFDYEQARAALDHSGNDFQVAVNTLIENRNAEANAARRKLNYAPPLPRRPQISRDSSDEEDYGQVSSQRKYGNDPRGYSRQQRFRDGFDMSNFQNRKEKFISNASTIGASVLSKANLLMKQASGKIREGIDEIQHRNESSRANDQFRIERPRWLQNYSDDDSSDEETTQATHHSYKNGYSIEMNNSVCAPSMPRQPLKERFNGVNRTQSHESLRSRRPPPRPPASLKNREASQPPASPRPFAIPQAQPQAQRPHRAIIPASLEQIQSSESQKAAGNEKFKLGQFGDAVEFYSKAISILPPNHDNLIPLYNNRAASRLKVGDNNGAISDCDQVVALIRDDYMYSSPNDSISFKDQYIKAITRRATANEAKEKFEAAENDFNKILTIDSRNKSGLEGVRRCQKAIKVMNGETTSKSSASSQTLETPASTDLFSFDQSSTATVHTYSATFGTHLDEFGFATTPPPSMKTSTVTKQDIDKSEAVSRLRAQERCAEREEEEKLRIIDMIEGRLNQWKSNKIGNLRAMLASLDTILWPDLNWKPCGLQDLIQPNQVKSKYIRAIAKLHPDKLSTDASVERKLLASGLFSILNEAWDQFKVQNGL
ncbi:hypothetical protein K493DRAFT_335315 [Basidiobolus meristosporus CBS 931.73]|uniref:UBA domain-containing protein n=1 Tax=Basidiobolus meristosporus CBS 931.73 TaxID=1314790 RepID=A0A1Y1YSC1_9FUNG|nr:hypothetical protein K493DRAFT_335315 [Basidiobolus meristosporus CBS 931.73]|eukprot:ORY00475.1 hypothetical protein K493DRAFT_335315 [Basidiobolus meristosporus CBS 931.73]